VKAAHGGILPAISSSYAALQYKKRHISVWALVERYKSCSSRLAVDKTIDAFK
jgi:hypothetical protein